MFKILKKTLLVLLIVFIAASPMACLDFGTEQHDREPSRDVNVGGEHGVTVEH